MRLEIVNSSVVVVGESYNPTALHPSFLNSQGIAPNDWQPVEPIISTPILSLVKYQNGYNFLCETNKFQITRDNPPESEDISLISKLSEKSLKMFPSVKYTAVGINFIGFIETKDAHKLLVSKFIKSGVWNEKRALKGLSVNFVYQLPKTILRVVCDSGSIKPQTEKTVERQGIVLNANYHRDIDQNDSPQDILKQTKKAISTYSKHLGHFSDLANSFFSLE